MERELWVRERQKKLLCSLLMIKSANPDTVVSGLQEEVIRAIVVMELVVVAWVEKIVGVASLD